MTSERYYGVLRIVSGLWIVLGIYLIVNMFPHVFVQGNLKALLSIPLALPFFLAGIGCFRKKEWARKLAIGISVLTLLGFPLGTIVGGFGLLGALKGKHVFPDAPKDDGEWWF